MGDNMVEDITELKREFAEKFRRMSDEEVEKFDEWFAEYVEPFVLHEFYGGYHPRGKHASEKRQKFLDYIYMYLIVHDLDSLDEREDQLLFSEALKYAEEHYKDD